MNLWINFVLAVVAVTIAMTTTIMWLVVMCRNISVWVWWFCANQSLIWFFFNSSPLMNHSKITSKLDLNYYIPLSCAPIGICTVRQEENPTHSYIISLKEFSGHLQEFELTIIIGFVSIITLSFENPLEVLLRSNFSKNYYTILWFMTWYHLFELIEYFIPIWCMPRSGWVFFANF